MVSDWGVHLLRHLQILVASFPERFLPDQIAELKQDHFCGRPPKQLKVMVAYLKVTTDEKTYSDYLWAVWEAEGEEAVGTSWSSATASTSKLRAISFFPLPKARGLSAGHNSLHVDGTPKREECWWGQRHQWWGPRWNWRCDRRVHCVPGQSSERCSGDREALLSLWHPRPLHLQLPMAGRNKGRCTFKPERGDSTEEGRLSPSRKDSCDKGAPGWDAQGVKCWAWTPFFNPDPLTNGTGLRM